MKTLTAAELAERWNNMSKQTLANWRSQGIGPGYIRFTGHGGPVHYPLDEVLAYEKKMAERAAKKREEQKARRQAKRSLSRA